MVQFGTKPFNTHAQFNNTVDKILKNQSSKFGFDLERTDTITGVLKNS